MPEIRSLCRPCRLHLASWPCTRSLFPPSPCIAVRKVHSLQQQPLKGARSSRSPLLRSQSRFLATNEAERDQPESQPELDSIPLESILADPNLSQDDKNKVIRDTFGPEVVARHARKRFGERLPDGALSDEEYKVYQRLFGAPLAWSPEHNEILDEEDSDDILLRETTDGSLEQVEYRHGVEDGVTGLAGDADEVSLDAVDPLLRDEIKAALRAEPQEALDIAAETPVVLSHTGEVIDQPVDGVRRSHPFTLIGRAGTSPSTLPLPRETMIEPISRLLSDVSNKHIREAGGRLFGGLGLPYSTGTPRSSRTMVQKPIPLDPSQAKMTPIEADVFIASLMPGMYASITSTLVETRRGLGSDWLQSLLLKEGGPSILDAGSGGAGVLAWRETLKAEWERLQEDRGPGLGLGPRAPAPLGKATVLTSSASLRHRMSSILENTTFLPRLPDYVHVEPRTPGEPGAPHGRKQYDIIVASHSLWSLPETWQRRQHIQNLWAMLSDNGGVLVLLEKGVPRGFEVIADARQYLLDRLMINDKETVPNSAGMVDDESEQLPPRPHRHKHASLGSIVAPCTTQSKCPMYRIPGTSPRRKDYCHFSQRYYRPSFQQNILGAKSRNHEDVEFSYVSVVRGKRPDEIGRVALPEAGGAERTRVQGKIANDRAFAGYEIGDPDLMLSGGEKVEAAVIGATARKIEAAEDGADAGSDVEPDVMTPPLPATPPPHPLTLPRLVLPPLKKPGHVLMDVCTPAGTLERWSITRSYSKQAYRDARKSAWGDLWALGAKTREGRRLRIGKGQVVDGKELQNDAEGDARHGEEGAEAVLLAKSDDRHRRKLRGREKARSRKREARTAMRSQQKHTAPLGETPDD